MANKKKPFYTKKTLLLFRLFALIAIVILITSSYINVIELSYSIWDSIPVTYDPITRFLLGDFPVIKTGFLALAGSTQISRMGSSPNLQRGCEPPEIR